MEASHSVPELVGAAQSTANACQNRISEIQSLKGAAQDLDAAIAELEAVVVDIFSVFEARMQHHFKRGPFSRKLKAKLLEAGEPDLADRLHQYYLAVNVLKHGKGASYRELLKNPSALITMNNADDVTAHEDRATSGLVDVTPTGFFDGLCATILEATAFLEG
jgi:hypothetical protein